jgi:hypothetical protein
MNVPDLLGRLFSKGGKALSLYKRGMAKAKQHDHQGAIDDYTTAISMPDTTANVKAMALYNRAMVYAAIGEKAKATDDLNVVLSMPEDLSEIKGEATRKLVRMERRSKNTKV